MFKKSIENPIFLERDKAGREFVEKYEGLLKEYQEFVRQIKGWDGNTIVKEINDSFENVTIKEYPNDLLEGFECSLLGDLKNRYQEFHDRINSIIEGRIISKDSKDNPSVLLSIKDRDEIAKECYFEPVGEETLKFKKAIEVINNYLKAHNLNDEWGLTIENCPGYTPAGDSLNKQIDLLINNKKERLQKAIENFTAENPIITTAYENGLAEGEKAKREEHIFGEKTQKAWRLMDLFWSSQYTIERMEGKNESERAILFKENYDYIIPTLVDNIVELNKQEKIKLIEAMIAQHPSDIKFGVQDKLKDLLEMIKKEYHKEDLPD